MLNRDYINKVEKLVEKKLCKFYKPECYCVVDRVVVELGDAEGLYDFTLRVGYSYPVHENDVIETAYEQKTFNFYFDANAFKTAGELASVIYVKAVELFDGYDSFTVR